MTWIVLDLNPEPWRVGPLQLGRRNGKMHPMVGRDQQLAAYQDAVRELLGEQSKITGQVHVKFFFWREQISYTGANKKVQKQHVDATNMQKATEDALQGVFFDNDSMVAKISSEVVEQGPDVKPRVVVFVEPYVGFNPDQIPTDMWAQIEHAPTLLDDNSWTGPASE